MSESPFNNGEGTKSGFDTATLDRIAPRLGNYALAPIQEGFDWSGILDKINDVHEIPRDQGLYLVVFRSQKRPEADDEMLTAYDTLAHEEAMESPSLLHYFKGETDSEGNCLSFCLWTSQADARKASSQPDHVAAAKLVARMYTTYALERYWVSGQGTQIAVTPL
jgi:hypothetical protein